MIKVLDQVRYLLLLNNCITLKKGDLIFTGTPAGVGEVNIGDVLEASVGDLDLLKINIKQSKALLFSLSDQSKDTE